MTISNVPGPEDTLYYEGARLEAMYPVSLIAHGGALNITCLSYAGSLNFGFTGCGIRCRACRNWRFIPVRLWMSWNR